MGWCLQSVGVPQPRVGGCRQTKAPNKSSNQGCQPRVGVPNQGGWVSPTTAEPSIHAGCSNPSPKIPDTRDPLATSAPNPGCAWVDASKAWVSPNQGWVGVAKQKLQPRVPTKGANQGCPTKGGCPQPRGVGVPNPGCPTKGGCPQPRGVGVPNKNCQTNPQSTHGDQRGSHTTFRLRGARLRRRAR